MENSLAEVRPDLAQEWSDRNLKLTPDDVSYGSTINVWWKGACGHEWVAPVCNRLRQYGAGCPYCAGRRLLRGFNDLATKFPDVAAEWSEKNLPQKADDVLAFSNQKAWWQGKCGHEWLARIADRSRGHGCPYCSSQKVLAGYNDFGSKYPELAEEWSTKNLPLTPQMIPVNKPGMFWWKCRDCGIEFKAWISTRIKNPSCPYCTGRTIVPGFNDLETTDPKIAAEWDYMKNRGKEPKQMHRSSKEAVWWLSPSGYSWQARICERTVDGMACRPSGAEYKRMLTQLLFLLYARRMDLRVYFDSDKLTGMSIEIVLPDIRLAVDMESERKTLTKEQTAKLHVCEAKHYDYILLKACSDPKAMAEQILRVFKMKHIFIPTNVDEDIRQAQTAFLNLMRLEIESTSET